MSVSWEQRACTSKTFYKSLSAAKEALELQKLYGKRDKDYSAYKCPFCPGCHIGKWHVVDGNFSDFYKELNNG